MSKPLIVTNVIYLTLFIAIAVLFREQIWTLCVRSQMSKSSYGIKLAHNISLLDGEGKPVGVLYRGMKLMRPNLEDVSDTDISDNMRFKLLVDLNLEVVLASEKDNSSSLIVYKIR